MLKKTEVVLAAVVIILGVSGLSFAASCCAAGHTEDPKAAPALNKSEAVNAGNKICPVMGEKIDEKTKATYEYEGKVYNFCCPGCIDEFKKDPGMYIKKIEAGASEHSEHQSIQ